MIGKTISHYRILEELDQGGMGVIYKAEDVHLGRPAALKFLPAAMCEDEELKDRFILEAKAASALDHPNICTIYEIGQTDEGHLFIAMAYYEGETLHKKISRGPLGQNVALDYVTQIAAGLAKSHELDIIHRDIKPANIFITSDGQVKILDFGLAKMLGEGVTLSGLAQGTPAYMAPERIRNERANPKTDLWSLGVLFHETLTGERPFSGRSVAEIIQAVHEDPPAPLTALRPKTPPELAAIVRKLLRKNPKKRYASCEDLLWDLEDLSTGKRPSSRKAAWISAWISASLVLLLLLASAGASCWLGRRGPDPATTSSKVAILPFENTSADPALDWMAQGIADLLLAALDQSPRIQIFNSEVVSANLPELGLGDAADPAKIGAELARRVGVDHVVFGRVAKSAGVPLIEVHLLDTRNGEEVFSRTVEIQGQNSVFSHSVFSHIDDVSLDIRRHLGLPTPMDSDLEVSKITTSSPAAWRFYSTGMQHHLRYDEQAAAESFQKAIKLDPQFGMAWAKLATVSRNLGRPEAAEYARQAVEHSAGLSARERHYIEGVHWTHEMRTWSKAIAAFDQAVRIDPHFYAARQNLAVIYTALEQYDAAVQQGEVLSRLEVPYRGSHATLAESYAGQGELGQAETLARAMVQRQSEDFVAHAVLGRCLQRRNRLHEALASFRRAEEIKPGQRLIFHGLCTTHLLRQEWAAASVLSEEGRKLEGSLSNAAGHCETLIALHRGRTAEALTLIDKLASVTPSGLAEAPLHLSAARVHLDRGEAELALARAEQARLAGHGQPMEGQALFLATWAEIQLRAWRPAERHIAELLELGQLIPDPFMTRQSRHLQGLLALARGRTDDAIAELEAAAETLPPRGIRYISHEPDHVLLWATLAEAYLRAEDDHRALAVLTLIEQSTEERVIYPVDYARSLYLLGKIHQRQGRDALADEFFTRFRELWKDGDLQPDQLSARFP